MNRKNLLALLAAAMLSSGCISQVTLGRMEGSVKPEQVLTRPEITNLIGRGVQVGQVATGALTVILCFICWYRATHGTPFVGHLKEWVLWVGLTVYLLATLRSGIFGPVMWLYQFGQYLGQLFSPPDGFLFGNHDAAVAKMAQFVSLVQRMAPNTGPAGLEAARMVESFAWWVLNPVAMMGIVLNGIAIHLFKLVLQVAYTFLLVFYWTLTPILAPLLVLPQTRHIFLGWVKSYASIALWPFFFAIAEHLAIAIPWSSWLGIENLSLANPVASVYDWTQGQLMLIVLNIAFLAVYASIPIVSSRIVNGASQPFRAGLL